MDTQMDKQNVHVHTMDCHLTLKRKEFLTFITTWVKLRDIILSKISQPHTNTHIHTKTYCMIPLIKDNTYSTQNHRDIKYLWDIQKAVRCQIVSEVDWDRHEL